MAVSESQKRATAKYHRERVEEIKFRVPIGQKDIIQKHARKMGESVNAFLFRAAKSTIIRDNDDI